VMEEFGEGGVGRGRKLGEGGNWEKAEDDD
jgi:hypothetical protein